MLRKKRIDICVLDIMLSPEPESGLDTIRMVRESGVPIISLTDIADVDQKAIEAGVDIFLRKPCPPERLQDVIETLRIRRDLQAQRKPIFVAHEFSQAQREDLRAALADAFEDTHFTLYYADVELRVGHILLGKIIERIKTTEFGIYDISFPGRPNVFLELGIAIGMAKPYYIIMRAGTEVPADLAGLDRIEYESFQDLVEQIKTKIAAQHAI